MNRQTNKFHCDLRHPTKKEMNMRSIKKWGIRVHDSGWIIDNNRKPAVYWKKAEAVKDAKDFNQGLKDKIYTVEEDKK